MIFYFESIIYPYFELITKEWGKGFDIKFEYDEDSPRYLERYFVCGEPVVIAPEYPDSDSLYDMPVKVYALDGDILGSTCLSNNFIKKLGVESTPEEREKGLHALWHSLKDMHQKALDGDKVFISVVSDTYEYWDVPHKYGHVSIAASDSMKMAPAEFWQNNTERFSVKTGMMLCDQEGLFIVNEIISSIDGSHCLVTYKSSLTGSETREEKVPLSYIRMLLAQFCLCRYVQINSLNDSLEHYGIEPSGNIFDDYPNYRNANSRIIAQRQARILPSLREVREYTYQLKRELMRARPLTNFSCDMSEPFIDYSKDEIEKAAKNVIQLIRSTSDILLSLRKNKYIKLLINDFLVLDDCRKHLDSWDEYVEHIMSNKRSYLARIDGCISRYEKALFIYLNLRSVHPWSSKSWIVLLRENYGDTMVRRKYMPAIEDLAESESLSESGKKILISDKPGIPRKKHPLATDAVLSAIRVMQGYGKDWQSLL